MPHSIPTKGGAVKMFFNKELADGLSPSSTCRREAAIVKKNTVCGRSAMAKRCMPSVPKSIAMRG